MGGYPWETVPSNCWAWFEAGTWRIRSCLCTPVRFSECREINKTNRRRRKKNIVKKTSIPKCSIFPHRASAGVDFIPYEDVWAIQRGPIIRFSFAHCEFHQRSQSYYFRAGSHMTFSSIFSPTSKTSISSSKIGRSEWQSTITDLFEAKSKSILRFWMCSLQFSKKTSNSKEIKFIS